MSTVDLYLNYLHCMNFVVLVCKHALYTFGISASVWYEMPVEPICPKMKQLYCACPQDPRTIPGPIRKAKMLQIPDFLSFWFEPIMYKNSYQRTSNLHTSDQYNVWELIFLLHCGIYLLYCMQTPFFFSFQFGCNR